MAVTHIEEVDLPTLIKNETRAPVGFYDKESTEFTKISIVKQKNQNFFVFADNTGHLTSLVKNLRLKSRIYTSSNGSPILDIQESSTHLLILHSKDIAFTSILDNSIAPIHCEASFTNEFNFAQFSVEKFRPAASGNNIFILTEQNQLLVYEYKFSATNSEQSMCKMTSSIDLPIEFTKGG